MRYPVGSRVRIRFDTVTGSDGGRLGTVQPPAHDGNDSAYCVWPMDTRRLVRLDGETVATVYHFDWLDPADSAALPCPTCGADLAPDGGTCGECGIPLRADDLGPCPGCGSWWWPQTSRREADERDGWLTDALAELGCVREGEGR